MARRPKKKNPLGELLKYPVKLNADIERVSLEGLVVSMKDNVRLLKNVGGDAEAEAYIEKCCSAWSTYIDKDVMSTVGELRRVLSDAARSSADSDHRSGGDPASDGGHANHR